MYDGKHVVVGERSAGRASVIPEVLVSEKVTNAGGNPGGRL